MSIHEESSLHIVVPHMGSVVCQPYLDDVLVGVSPETRFSETCMTQTIPLRPTLSVHVDDIVEGIGHHLLEPMFECFSVEKRGVGLAEWKADLKCSRIVSHESLRP